MSDYYDACVADSIVWIIVPRFPIRRGTLLGDISTSSPELILPRSLSAIVIMDHDFYQKLAILASTKSPICNLDDSSSLCAEKSLPNTSCAGRNPE